MDLCTTEIVIFIKSFGYEELRTDLASSSTWARERNKLPLQYEASIGWLLPEGGQRQPGPARASVVFALRIPSSYFFKKTAETERQSRHLVLFDLDDCESAAVTALHFL